MQPSSPCMDSPAPRSRNTPSPRPALPRTNTPDRALRQPEQSRPVSSTAQRSSSTPHALQKALQELNSTPRRTASPSAQRPDRPQLERANSDTPKRTESPSPLQKAMEVLNRDESGKAMASPHRRSVGDISSRRTEQALLAAMKPRVKASVITWLEDVLKPRPKGTAPARKARPASQPGEGENCHYEEITFGPAIGAGSFGAVWKGSCRGEVVAIKQCKVGDPHDAEMLIMEIGYLQKLRHPRLVSFLGCCNRPPHVILLIEFMSGGSLYALLFKGKDKEKAKNMAFGVKAKMALHVVEGMEYLHKLSVVHRDLKTMNIVLDDELNCKICDFGLTITLERTHMTVKSLQGSPRYMAPEQFESNAKISEKVDIWQLGCVMLELFCLTVPFANAAGVQQIATDLLVRKRPPTVPSEADPRARTLILVCLKIQPAMRPTAEALNEALSGLCRQENITP